MPQFVQCKHIVSIPPDDQRFGAVAGGRPGLEQWEKELAGIDKQNNRARRLSLRIGILKDGRNHADMRVRAVGARVQIS